MEAAAPVLEAVPLEQVGIVVAPLKIWAIDGLIWGHARPPAPHGTPPASRSGLTSWTTSRCSLAPGHVCGAYGAGGSRDAQLGLRLRRRVEVGSVVVGHP